MPDNYLRFWGVRGSCPAPFDTHLEVGGNTSCVELRVGDQVLVCDAGTGIIPLGSELAAHPDIRELTIVLTHYHWDHISGLPFFVPAFLQGWTINFFGPGEDQTIIGEHISDQMKAPYFPVETETWLADIHYLPADRQPVLDGDIRVQSFNVHHPGTTYGYRMDACGKSVVYVSDNELAFIDQSIDERMPEFDDREQALLEEMKREEKDRSIEFMAGVDILIHDAQYTTEDYSRKRGWGHSCYIDTVNFAIEAGVKTLYLFHHDPNYDDRMVDQIYQHSLELIREARSSLKCHLATEGLCVDLDG